MQHTRFPTHASKEETRHRLSGTMALMGLGLAILAFLVAIDRPEWFHIRPATGTSMALSHAMDAPDRGDPAK